MRVVVVICLFFVLTGCKKSDHLSDCIESKINGFSSSSFCIGASVKEYSFHGKLVYVFSEGLCFVDVGDAVYEANCNYLGALGGNTSGPKIDDNDFGANAKYRRTIWHN